MPDTHTAVIRFPKEIISEGVWLYFRFSISFLDVEEMVAAGGVAVSFGNLVRVTESGDAGTGWNVQSFFDSQSNGGVMTNSGSYDYDGRLKGSYNLSGNQESYLYDAASHRVMKVFYNAYNGPPAIRAEVTFWIGNYRFGTYQFLWDSNTNTCCQISGTETPQIGVTCPQFLGQT